ncbi:hypothetical protein M3650_29665 [Paenibacillus sp. MER TA 81-3]|uniref:hypothetical protein n=1 Tax=Paenibacillus sp. MER TA 81-3 TaxID=2939573 RepID=UPI00203C9B47|nr:hypothetical protein [Paenibacillus sp. MER TA 81-3]MCM3342678.1 hypothetical protein [Paenibacillus sp. MER TA 81-3]
MKYSKEELDLINHIDQHVKNKKITYYKAIPQELYQKIKAIMRTKNFNGSLQEYFEFLGYIFIPTSKYPKDTIDIITLLMQHYPSRYVTNLENIDRNLYYIIQDKALQHKVDIPEYINKLGFNFVFNSNIYPHSPTYYIGTSEKEYIKQLNKLFPEGTIIIEELIEKDSWLFKSINYLRQIRSIQTIDEQLEFFGFKVFRRWNG